MLSYHTNVVLKIERFAIQKNHIVFAHFKSSKLWVTNIDTRTVK